MRPAEKNSRARRWAARPSSPRRAGSRINSSTAAAIAATSPKGTSIPLTLCSTTSGIPPTRGGDARTGKTHRLQNAQAEGFQFRGKESQVGRLQVVLDVVDFFAHDDTVLQTEPPHLALERGEAVPGQDDQLEGLARTEAGDGFEQQVNPFGRAEIGGMENQRFVAQAQFAPHRFARSGGAGAARKNYI